MAGVALSLPCIVGKDGVSKVIELSRKDGSYTQLQAIAAKMQLLVFQGWGAARVVNNFCN